MKSVLTAIAAMMLPIYGQISINFTDAPGAGFFDQSPASPIGGNTGTTLGEQRRNVMQAAVDVWTDFLEVNGPVIIDAGFDDLFCSPMSGTLANAGPGTYAQNFPGAPQRDTFFASAIVNHITGRDNFSGAEIFINVNENIDSDSNCLGGRGFYYGLDNNPASKSDLLATLTHEVGHGLGFISLVSPTTGAFLFGRPDSYTANLRDEEVNLDWTDMTNAQRVTSSTNNPFLVWKGENTNLAAEGLLVAPASRSLDVSIDLRNGLTDRVEGVRAEFGPEFNSSGFTGDVIEGVDSVAPFSDGCQPFTNTLELGGNVALIDRGSCNFDEKVFRAQTAGAVAVILVNNEPGAPFIAGGDNLDENGAPIAITIPTLMVSQATGDFLRSATFRAPRITVIAAEQMAGTFNGQVRLYAPDPFEGGSSVSHFSTAVAPDALMEPIMTRRVREDPDLALTVMREIGWTVKDIPFPNLTYELWAAQNISNSTDRGRDADPDGDGLSNFEEYAGASGPDDSAEATPPRILVEDGALVALMTNQATDLTSIIQQSDDLGSFVPAQGVTLDESEVVGERLESVFSFTIDQEARFYRLMIEE